VKKKKAGRRMINLRRMKASLTERTGVALLTF